MIGMGLEISVVIPTYNRLEDLRKCLEALERQTFGCSRFEVVVIDGGSSDGTLDFLEKFVPGTAMRLSYLVEPKRGAAAARNAGVLRSKAAYVAFTDDDCIPEPEWLSDLFDSFPRDGNCAGVGGRVTPQANNIISRYIDYFRVSRAIEFGDTALYLVTANAMYRRPLLMAVGIFDERIIYGEDTNLSLKLLKRGYYLKSLDVAVVRHKDPTDVYGLYRKFWCYGSGLAAVARLEGKQADTIRNALLGKLFFPDSYFERYVKKKKLSMYETFAFALLHRVQTIGYYLGFCSGMKR
jgi:glycosyltransferase involved in cell wall biosynthesis